MGNVQLNNLSRMKKIILFSLFFIGFVQAKAQTSLFQTGDGETTLKINAGTNIILNSGEESITFGYSKLTNFSPINIGFTGKLKTEEGISRIIKNGRAQPDGGVSLYLAYEFPEKKIIWIYTEFDYQFSRYQLVDTTLSFDNQIINDSSSGYQIKLGINLDYSPLSLIAGINGGWQNRNNADVLSASTINDVILIEEGSKTREIETKKGSAYDVEEFIENQRRFSLNADLGYNINRIMLMGHYRSRDIEDLGYEINPAFGIYLTEKGGPLASILGIQVQWEDFFDKRKKENNRSDRLNINVVAKIKI